MLMRLFVTTVTVISFTFPPAVVPDAAAGSSPAQKCAAAKMKAAGKKYAARANCYAKALSKSVPVDTGCLQNAEDKFGDAFAKAEAKGGCTTPGDAAAIEVKVDVCVADIAGDVGCGNGELDGDEECDDGNTMSGDGCSATCQNQCIGNGGVCANDAQCCSANCVSLVCAAAP
jgi:cysteine-rich repeat protein